MGPRRSFSEVELEGNAMWAVYHLAQKYTDGCVPSFIAQILTTALATEFKDELEEDLKTHRAAKGEQPCTHDRYSFKTGECLKCSKRVAEPQSDADEHQYRVADHVDEATLPFRCHTEGCVGRSDEAPGWCKKCRNQPSETSNTQVIQMSRCSKLMSL